ncbi:Ankyrin Repeat [Seminavis robusta]|uniref:Ankyrin Repeat n=1 Tax=Seminavis robusta TaxID=568900 RepID=A0A9N8H644_9STRA|nr:Ankyrin Repeat [Seminavis robusta]|eukprot:Sro89_g047150.1 Ankyrin Repeat (922) ;mRNA; f:116456-119221
MSSEFRSDENMEEWAGNDQGQGHFVDSSSRSHHSLHRNSNPNLGGSGIEAFGHGSFTDIGAAGGVEEDEGPARLFSILEEAVPRPNEETDLNHRRELVEQTWDLVRRWLWTHQDAEERCSAAYIRGQANATPLHLMCKLNNPPSDLIQDIVDAAPDVAGWTDSHGWLPLHHACANGASPDVLRILIDAYPDGKITQDSLNRTPLHFYATRNSDNLASMVENVELLCDSGAAELTDKGGMLPMHYACAYGTSDVVLKVLADAYPDSLTAREQKGRTPMHLAMVNAHRDASPGVIRFLLEGEGSQTVNRRDHDGFLPLHLLAKGLENYRADGSMQRNNVSECLEMYLSAGPTPDADFLTALQDLPDWLQDTAVINPHVRNILNQKIIQRFPTSILMLDGYALFFLIVAFEFASKNHIELRFYNDRDPGEERPGWPVTNETSVAIIVLFAGATYFLGRELVQIISLISLGGLKTWFTDATNYLDMAVIISVYYNTILMVNPGFGDASGFRASCAFTKGILWAAVIYFLKSTNVQFAVFVGGVYFVINRLIAFLLAVGIMLLAFAQMFFIVYLEDPICTGYTNNVTTSTTGENLTMAPTMTLDGEVYAEDPSDCQQFPHCMFWFSLLKVYTMMMGEIGTETRYYDRLVAQLLYLLYAFVVVILLSNMLIAIVTDLYEVIQHDRAAIVFWSNRLDFVAEMDAISYGTRKRIRSCFGEKGGGGLAPGAPSEVVELPNGAPQLSAKDNPDEDDNAAGTKYFREGWKQLMMLFDSNLYDDIDLTPGNIEFWCYLCFQILAVIFFIPLWLMAGVATAGWLWPPQVREYLFVQKETAISRAELEHKKLEQLKQISGELKSFKADLGREMQSDRDDMVRLKLEVEAVQSEVLSDLMQVKELMQTLLDLGGGGSLLSSGPPGGSHIQPGARRM